MKAKGPQRVVGSTTPLSPQDKLSCDACQGGSHCCDRPQHPCERCMSQGLKCVMQEWDKDSILLRRKVRGDPPGPSPPGDLSRGQAGPDLAWLQKSNPSSAQQQHHHHPHDPSLQRLLHAPRANEVPATIVPAASQPLSPCPSSGGEALCTALPSRSSMAAAARYLLGNDEGRRKDGVGAEKEGRGGLADVVHATRRIYESLYVQLLLSLRMADDIDWSQAKFLCRATDFLYGSSGRFRQRPQWLKLLSDIIFEAENKELMKTLATGGDHEHRHHPPDYASTACSLIKEPSLVPPLPPLPPRTTVAWVDEILEGVADAASVRFCITGSGVVRQMVRCNQLMRDLFFNEDELVECGRKLCLLLPFVAIAFIAETSAPAFFEALAGILDDTTTETHGDCTVQMRDRHGRIMTCAATLRLHFETDRLWLLGCRFVPLCAMSSTPASSSPSLADEEVGINAASTGRAPPPPTCLPPCTSGATLPPPQQQQQPPQEQQLYHHYHYHYHHLHLYRSEQQQPCHQVPFPHQLQHGTSAVVDPPLMSVSLDDHKLVTRPFLPPMGGGGGGRGDVFLGSAAARAPPAQQPISLDDEELRLLTEATSDVFGW